MKHALEPDQIAGWTGAYGLFLAAISRLGWDETSGALDLSGKAARGLRALVRRAEQYVRGMLLLMAVELMTGLRRTPRTPAQTAPPPPTARGPALPAFRLLAPQHAAPPPTCWHALTRLRTGDATPHGAQAKLVQRLLALEAIFHAPHRAARKLARRLQQRPALARSPALTLPPFTWSPGTWSPCFRSQDDSALSRPPLPPFLQDSS